MSMKRELICLANVVAVLIVISVALKVVNTDNAEVTPVLTVGEELGLTAADFIFSDAEVQSEVQSMIYMPTVNKDAISTDSTHLTLEELEAMYGEGFINLLSRAVEAEAGNQDLKGRQLVADVILNRIDSDRFPNDLHNVIYQKNAFAVVSDKRIYSVEVSELTLKAIESELNSRLDTEILFFSAGSYNKYCRPGYPHGDHFFGY